MTVRLARPVLLAALLFGSTNLAAAADGVAERQIAVIADALSPSHVAGRAFVVRYAHIVRSRVGNLDEFEKFWSTSDSVICNLLCRAHVTQGFFRAADRGPSELIRYALGHTCYGVMPGARHKGEALRDLDAALGADNWYRNDKLSPQDKATVRSVVGDALKSYLESNNISDPAKSPLIQSQFGRVWRLWKAAYSGGSSITNGIQTHWSMGQAEVAASTCANSDYDRSTR